MKMRWFGSTALILGMMLVLIMAGCSSDNVSGPVNSADNPSAQDGSGIYLVGDGVVKLNAQGKTTDQNKLMISFSGLADTVVAFHNCEIVRYSNENDSPIPFVDIVPGDMATVFGKQQQDGYINAFRIRVYGGDCPQYDVAFRDTIATIDYSAGTFTVNHRTETINVDENTLITSRIGGQKFHTNDMIANTYQYQTGSTAKVTAARDTVLEFTDLSVGDVVEVRANIIDENNLLAVVIKVPHSNFMECEQFDAYLASVDYENSTVTFEGLPWIGLICKNALLLGLDGETLTLEDFAAGDYVSVKGLPLEDDELKICKMEKIEAEG